MYSPMPIYSYNKEVRPRAPKDVVSPTPEIRRPSTASSPKVSSPQIRHDIDDSFEAAIDGPPSPGRIRAFNNQMKRNASADRHRSEVTTSSGSSSRLSANSDRPSWNQSAESLGLSRNPSQRSTSSGVVSRERPDSVQFFGKAIFNRSRGRLHREHSAPNSSNSSLDAVDMSGDLMSATLKEQHFIQSVFARRRALRGEAAAPTQKKLQISGPYNFQHVTHTHKDSVPDLDRRTRMDLVSEFSGMRPRRPTDASLNRFYSDDSQPTSSENLHHQEDPSAGLNANGPQPRDKALPPPPPPSPPMRSAKRSQSQDKIRFAPPRPPRSPEGSRTSNIPPRTSSRVSVRHDRFGSLSGMNVERPATVTGFRKPIPFDSVSPKSQPVAPVSPVVESEQEEEVAMQSIAYAITTPDDAAWPLSNNVTPLSDVPEEEEHHALTRSSRMSVASNPSSLRGSISVPLLRQFSMAQSHQPSPSNASETLGRFDLISAQRTLRPSPRDDDSVNHSNRESWEDDIDYCYEHEAEADCDFAWERPSCDIVRPTETKSGRIIGDQTETIITVGGLSPGLLSPGSSDVPVLSPASQISTSTQHEAITPTNIPAIATSNFSLPRRDSSAQLLHTHRGNQSPESNFKEAQGFSISPSLLIPDDYHQQMLQYEREDLQDSDDEDFVIQGTSLNDEPIMKFGKPSNARSSASTTDSALSEQSMTSSRHKSTASTSTAYTRWTGSSTSSWTAREAVLPKPTSDVVPSVIISPGKVITPPNFNEPIVMKKDTNHEKHSRTQSHADLLMGSKCNNGPPVEPKPVNQTVRTRRRARTTSRSHASPQFALFPTVTALPGGRI